jgi:ATP-dependent Zn protease
MGIKRRRRDGGPARDTRDVEPLPPPEYRSRERDEERLTRKRLALWDRIKLLLLLVVAILFLLSATITSNPPLQAQFLHNPLVGIADAIRMDLGTYVVLAVFAGLEVIRQLHYLVSEHWSAYHLFWSRKVFGRFEGRRGRMDDWTRYRVQRMFRIGFLLIIADLVLASVFDLPVATALIEAPGALLGVLPLALRLLFAFFFVIVQFVGLFWFLSRGGVDVYFPDDIKTRFTDVWGQDNVLEKIKENMVFLEDPERIEARGGYVPGGILLWGPPGTGKTLMAEAVAGETGKPFVFVDPGAFTNMFMGVGILKVKSLFRKARKLALRYGGVILFFDEADSLGSRGALAQPPGSGVGMGEADRWTQFGACNGLSYLQPATARMVWHTAEPRGGTRDGVIMGGMGGGGGMGTLNALLTELSGLKKPRGFFNRVVRRALGLRPKPPPRYRIMVMMATNLPQALDEALLRPGRIDRIYKVGYPSKLGRIRTYQGYFDKVSHELSHADLDKLATITPYATGASMKDLVNEALINSLRAGRDKIVWADVVKAKHLKELGPPEDVEYIERERHAVAVHEACHAVMAHRVRQHLTIDIATIEKGGTYLGMVASIPPEDQFTRWRSEYESDILVSLASLVGERLFFEGDNSSGVSGDLESATRVATMMEGYWGMGSTIASHGVTRQAGIPGGRGGPGGDDDRERDLLSGDLGARIESKLASLLTRAEDLLRDNRPEVLAVAHALERHKTVTGDDVRAIIEGMPGPLIDGRPYHTEAFLEAAEAYHERLAEAHRAHAASDVPLPELPALASVSPAGDGQSPDVGQSPAAAVEE